MYYLLNKYNIVASFEIRGTGSLEYIEILKHDRKQIPFWINDLNIFISNRKSPKHRENIEILFKQCNCNTLSGYLDVSHALSLNDSFWVKRVIK